MATITVYDGAQCIGGTKLEIRDATARVIFDFGANFTAEALYFDSRYPTKKGYEERLATMRSLNAGQIGGMVDHFAPLRSSRASDGRRFLG